jgi:hypothetical protein
MYKRMLLAASMALSTLGSVGGARAAEDYGACATEAARLLHYGGAAFKITDIKNDPIRLEVTYTYQFGQKSTIYDLDASNTVESVHEQMHQEEQAVHAGSAWYVIANLMADADPGDPIAYKGLSGSKYQWTAWTEDVMDVTQGADGPQCTSSSLGKYVNPDVLPPEVIKLLGKWQ